MSRLIYLWFTVVLGSIGACNRNHPVRPPEAAHDGSSASVAKRTEPTDSTRRESSATDQSLTADHEIALATKWLAALRRRDVSGLTRLTSYPFILRDTRSQGSCKDRRTAVDPDSVPATVKCLMSDEWLDRALKANPVPVLERLSDFPAWAKPWRESVSGDLQSLYTTADAPGCEFDFVLLVAKEGVRALWKTGSTVGKQDMRPPDPPEIDDVAAPNEIRLATKWLDALRNRDIEALTKVTHFPFRMHDTSSAGECEGKSAAAAPNLPAAISCLTTSKLLEQDLQINPARPEPLTRAISKRNIPSWARRWRGDFESGSQPVWTTIYADGVTWDFIFLVASDGVQSLWKAGWFDPN
jgi:hypothetical protein